MVPKQVDRDAMVELIVYVDSGINLYVWIALGEFPFSHGVTAPLGTINSLNVCLMEQLNHLLNPHLVSSNT